MEVVKVGVMIVGEVSTTNFVPVPVCEAMEVAFPTLVMGPVRLALVVALPAVSPGAVPVMFVPTSTEGVPKLGVTRVGEVANTLLPVPVTEVKPEYSMFQEAAVVPLVKMQVSVAWELATIATMAFPPLELTVTTPVLLLTMVYCWPSAKVLVTGIVTV